jgi:hypothetical protein
MGLDIPEYPVYNYSSTVDAYTNIRDILQTKENNVFMLSGFAKITTNKIFIEAIHIQLKSATVFTDSWGSLYTELKRLLTEKNIAHADS